MIISQFYQLCAFICFTDVYVFAVGDEVNRKDLTSIASSKKDEEHIFVLKDYTQLGFVFNRMISELSDIREPLESPG